MLSKVNILMTDTAVIFRNMTVCGTDIKGKGFGRKEITICRSFLQCNGFNLDLYGDHS